MRVKALDPEIGEYRWLVHMIDFFRYCSNFDYCVVDTKIGSTIQRPT